MSRYDDLSKAFANYMKSLISYRNDCADFLIQILKSLEIYLEKENCISVLVDKEFINLNLNIQIRDSFKLDSKTLEYIVWFKISLSNGSVEYIISIKKMRNEYILRVNPNMNKHIFKFRIDKLDDDINKFCKEFYEIALDENLNGFQYQIENSEGILNIGFLKN